MSAELVDIIVVTVIEGSPKILLDIGGNLLKTKAFFEDNVIKISIEANQGNLVEALTALSLGNLQVRIKTIHKHGIYKSTGNGTRGDLLAIRCFIPRSKFDFEGPLPQAFSYKFKAVDVTGGDLSDTLKSYTFFSEDEFNDGFDIDSGFYNWKETNPRVTDYTIVKSEEDVTAKYRYITLVQETEESTNPDPFPPPRSRVIPLSILADRKAIGTTPARGSLADTSTPFRNGAALDTALPGPTLFGSPPPTFAAAAAPSVAPLAPPAPLASAKVEESLGRPAKAAEEKLMDARQVAGLGAAAFAIAALGFLSAL